MNRELPRVKTLTPARAFLAIVSFFALAALTFAESPQSTPVPLGNNTYSLVRQAKNGFQRDTELLKSQAKEDAQIFCQNQGRQMKILELTAEKPWFAMGYATAKIVFQALSPNDPALNPSIATASASSESVPHAITNTTELYNELMRLDELHKKGILTDDEFQSEKQKVLARSK